jgi:hypothetical protein
MTPIKRLGLSGNKPVTMYPTGFLPDDLLSRLRRLYRKDAAFREEIDRSVALGTTYSFEREYDDHVEQFCGVDPRPFTKDD